MREFLILFKHEIKMLFPVLSVTKKKKRDFFGALLSILVTLLLVATVIVLLSRIAKGYVSVKVNKVLNPYKRATELINIVYCFIIVVMVFACVRKIGETLASKKNKEIYLRLPIKQQTLFLSKLLALLIWTFIFGFILILPTNIIFYNALNISFTFWLKTIFVLLTLPLVIFGISILLIVPYLKLVDFLKNKYLVLFLLLSGLLIGVFVLYSKFLGVVQLWLETGSIKFLFNAEFVSSLKSWLKWAYPSNCFANIMFGGKWVLPLITILLIIALSMVVAYAISSKLFYLTLYKSERERLVGKPKNKYHQFNPVFSLMKKEFICVSRNPKHLFSYLTIATAMPVMVYCCYTLFESLISNAFGIKITFSLALTVLLMFSVLTNTFCATNVTRDGISFLKMKSVAIKPTTMLFAKVLFCGIVSTISIVISTIILMIVAKLSILDGLLCIAIVTIFSYAQIMLATRLDLNHTRFTSTTAEVESSNSKTVTKVVFLGLILALIVGIVSVVIMIFSKGGGVLPIIKNLNLKTIYAYIIPFIVCVLYFIYAVIYYRYKINKSFDALSD